MANPNTDSPHRTIDGRSGNFVTESRFAMTTNDTDKRATVQIGSLSVDGFQMLNGNYQMSPTQAMGSVGKSPRNAGRLLESKGIKALQGAGYTPDAIEVASSEQTEVNNSGSKSSTLDVNLGCYRKSMIPGIINMEKHPCPETAAVRSDKVVLLPLQGGDVH